jgi:hypothetical protein
VGSLRGLIGGSNTNIGLPVLGCWVRAVVNAVKCEGKRLDTPELYSNFLPRFLNYICGLGNALAFRFTVYFLEIAFMRSLSSVTGVFPHSRLPIAQRAGQAADAADV